MSFINLPIETIRHRADARQRGDEALAALAASISEIGLINPIRVRQVGEDYEVVAGSHRLQAIDSLGWSDVPCIVVDDDDLHAELAMIDENLVRAELSPSDRARQTARRKAIYLELHPDTAHGGDRSEASRQVGDLKEADRFTAETASATGKSERAVQRDAERGEKIEPAALDIISGTKADLGVVMERLKSVPRPDQIAAARREVERSQASRPMGGGIAARYAGPAPVAADPAQMFDRFVRLVDEIEAIPVSELIAGAGRQRSVLGQRASGLASRMSDIMEGLDR